MFDDVPGFSTGDRKFPSHPELELQGWVRVITLPDPRRACGQLCEWWGRALIVFGRLDALLRREPLRTTVAGDQEIQGERVRLGTDEHEAFCMRSVPKNRTLVTQTCLIWRGARRQSQFFSAYLRTRGSGVRISPPRRAALLSETFSGSLAV